MVCIYCKNSTKISNSRHLARKNGTWRRRNCQICNVTFSTIETPDYSTIWSLARNNSKRLEPFNRTKLYISIYESLKHRPRALEEADELTNTILIRLSNIVIDGLVFVDDLRNCVFNTLSNFDNTSLVYYKAYFDKD
jgi:transcriptional regulator NrdR family protein